MSLAENLSSASDFFSAGIYCLRHGSAYVKLTEEHISRIEAGEDPTDDERIDRLPRILKLSVLSRIALAFTSRVLDETEESSVQNDARLAKLTEDIERGAREFEGTTEKIEKLGGEISTLKRDTTEIRGNVDRAIRDIGIAANSPQYFDDQRN